MKKFLCILLCAVILMSVYGCTPDTKATVPTAAPAAEPPAAEPPAAEPPVAAPPAAEAPDIDDYDYDKGFGYSAPKEGQSFSDYVKEQDPELYESITDIYNDAVGNSSSKNSDNYDYDKGFGYSAPKEGQSFSDYVKEQDPELYDSLFG